MPMMALHLRIPAQLSLFPALLPFLPSLFKLCHFDDFDPKLMGNSPPINRSKAITRRFPVNGGNNPVKMLYKTGRKKNIKKES